jgi:hypothetical protein
MKGQNWCAIYLASANKNIYKKKKIKRILISEEVVFS